MPGGKPAGVRCIQLDDDNRCMIFGRPERPAVCGGLQAQAEMCGPTALHAMQYLGRLEMLTSASPPPPRVAGTRREDRPAPT
jgi:hypothetical protein